MEHVLIATLGESPIVVSGMAVVLQQQEGITLDKVQIVYPAEISERWIERGYEMLAELLQDQLAVEPIPLLFDDARTEEHSLAFLRELDDALQTHTVAGNAVYLSLAGGRKHISALMAVLPQFHPCIKGLYHLHDTEAHNSRRQLTVSQLERLAKAERRQHLFPPAERFRLVKLPLPQQPLAQAIALRQWLKQSEDVDTPPPIPLAPAAESFYGQLFHAPVNADTTRFAVWLTQTAYDQYCEWFKQGSTRLSILDAYLREMANPSWYESPGRVHHRVTDSDPAHLQEGSKTSLIHMTCKKKGTAERVFCYTQPHAIGARNRQINRIIVTRFPVHDTAKDYDISLEDWVKRADIVPKYRLTDLPSQRVTLIASLGETPMVVTQAYTLLQSAQHMDLPMQVAAIHVVYPGEYPLARNSARILQNVCQRRRIDLQLHPLPIEDLDSPETVTRFIDGMRQAVRVVRQQEAEAKIALLLSGGRKGMSALAFYLAQMEKITQVYHTTIHDPAREREIEERTSYDALRSLPIGQQAERLFLESFPLTDFTLIAVPVIAFVQK